MPGLDIQVDILNNIVFTSRMQSFKTGIDFGAVALFRSGHFIVMVVFYNQMDHLWNKEHKHCSWMNQIEIWFGIINRKLLKRQSYTSVEEPSNANDYLTATNHFTHLKIS